MYDNKWVKDHYNKIGKDEALRLFKNPEEEMKYEVHAHYLRQNIKRNDLVLEIGAGPGVFTKVLHDIGARITVVDISEMQIKENIAFSKENNISISIDSWHVADICDLSIFGNDTFDHVVAYGGPVSYVFERASDALTECYRVLKNNGKLLISVMSLWGTINTQLFGVLKLPMETNRKIIETGNLSKENIPGHNHFCKLYTSKELLKLLEINRFKENSVLGSSFLTTKYGNTLSDIRSNEDKWRELIDLEIRATRESGCSDCSSHIISISKKSV